MASDSVAARLGGPSTPAITTAPPAPVSGVVGWTQVELVISPFAGFGRVAHLRRYIQTLPPVLSVRILGYAERTVRMLLEVEDGTPPQALVVPGTTLRAADASCVELDATASR